MFRSANRLVPLLTVTILIAGSGAAHAGLLKGHPYVDRFLPSPTVVATTEVPTAVYCICTPSVGTDPAAVCPMCGSKPPLHGAKPPHHGAKPPHYGAKPPHSGAKPPHPGAKPPRPGVKPPHPCPGAGGKCTKPAQQILGVCGPDGMRVWIEGTEVRRPKLAGKHRGYSYHDVTDLPPRCCEKYEVKAAIRFSRDGVALDLATKQVAVPPGQKVIVCFSPAEFARHDPEVNAVKAAERATDEATRIRDQANRARDEAQKASDDANSAKDDAKKARDEANRARDDAKRKLNEITKLHKEVSRAAVRAEEAAIQAARSNTEQFEFVHDHKPQSLQVRYNADREVAELKFGDDVWPSLEFHETSGALQFMRNVKIKLRYHFIAQAPKDGGGFEDVPGVGAELMNQATEFNDGRAEVKFYEPGKPEEHLSAKFCEEIRRFLKRHHEATQIKVAIFATRPNGQEATVAPEGNRITIQLK